MAFIKTTLDPINTRAADATFDFEEPYIQTGIISGQSYTSAQVQGGLPKPSYLQIAANSAVVTVVGSRTEPLRLVFPLGLHDANTGGEVGAWRSFTGKVTANGTATVTTTNSAWVYAEINENGEPNNVNAWTIDFGSEQSKDRTYTTSTTEPTSPGNGDLWFDVLNNKLYKYSTDEARFNQVKRVYLGEAGIGNNGYLYTIQSWFPNVEYARFQDSFYPVYYENPWRFYDGVSFLTNGLYTAAEAANWANNYTIAEGAAGNQIAMNAIANSATALAETKIAANSANAFANSAIALTTLSTNTTFIDGFANSDTVATSFANNLSATTNLANNAVWMNSIANSATYINAVANSTISSNVFANSDIAMIAIANGTLAVTAFANSNITMPSFANSDVAMIQLANSAIALNNFSNNLFAVDHIIESNENAITITETSSLTANAELQLTPYVFPIYYLVIGGGGSGGTYAPGSGYQGGYNGSNSVFDTIVSLGGGGGGGGNSSQAVTNPGSGRLAQAGGSGGGGGGYSPITTGGAGTPGQGFAGGNAGGPGYQSGGGGGAGSVGQNSSAPISGAGGIGQFSDITGTAIQRAGGGGGFHVGANTQISGFGGAGGGSNGTNIGFAGTPGSGSNNALDMTGSGSGASDSGIGAGAGGGGAGGYRTNWTSAPSVNDPKISGGNSAIEPFFTGIFGKSYTVTVGSGGSGAATNLTNSQIYYPGGRVGAGGSGTVILRVPNYVNAKFSSGVEAYQYKVGSDYVFQVANTSTASETVTFYPEPLEVDYLIVGGGGGGGSERGGGGGAGGVVNSLGPSSSNALSVVYNKPYPILIGAGGTGGTPGPSGTNGSNGSNSIFATITAFGGTGGGQSDQTGNRSYGGSGGGAGGGGAGGDGTDVYPKRTPSQANIGGYSKGAPAPYLGGGGGGASGEGGKGMPSGPGAGGNGRATPITGTPATFGGGGGGGCQSPSPAGSGGSGGGGAGSNAGAPNAATSGTVNSGGGGGGGGQDPGSPSTPGAGGAGGSGRVILKIPSSANATFSPGVTASANPSSVPGYVIWDVTATSGASETVTFNKV